MLPIPYPNHVQCIMEKAIEKPLNNQQEIHVMHEIRDLVGWGRQ